MYLSTTSYQVKWQTNPIRPGPWRGYSSCCSCRPAFCNSRRHRVEPAGSLNLPTSRITGSTPLTVSPHPSQHATDQRVKLPNAILQGRSCQAPPKQGEVWAVCFSCHKGLVLWQGNIKKRKKHEMSNMAKCIKMPNITCSSSSPSPFHPILWIERVHGIHYQTLPTTELNMPSSLL